MTKLKVVFSIDATGGESDIIEEIFIPSDTCLYCLHDRHMTVVDNRLHNEIMTALKYKGYDLRYFFQLMKVYTI